MILNDHSMGVANSQVFIVHLSDIRNWCFCRLVLTWVQ